jgi:23S rRNA U2552 (ribose-2'-O)-methylase RlmE/FtsJ
LTRYFEQGWENKLGDEHFAQRREKANTTDAKGRRRLFNMMQAIGKELQDATGAFSFDKKLIQVLDLCMAPGGFAAYALQENPMGVVDAFSLPEAEGGHPVLVPKRDTRVRVHLADITMWAEELGVDDIPDNHPDVSKFCSGWPYPCRAYDLVICDGQALPTQEVAEYRKRTEQTRLINSQLVLGLQRIKVGGTLIVLLHKPYKWRCVRLLYAFSRFSDIQLFKHRRYHAEKSSFYLVAKNVQPKREEAIQAMNTFRNSWYCATFGADQSKVESDELGGDDIASVLAEFGPAFIELARPIWAIQAAALGEARWMRRDRTEENGSKREDHHNCENIDEGPAK